MAAAFNPAAFNPAAFNPAAFNPAAFNPAAFNPAAGARRRRTGPVGQPLSGRTPLP